MDLYSIFFGFPSIVIIVLLAFIGIYQTIKDIVVAIRIEDYNHVGFVFCITVLAAVTGWVIGALL